jgi:hypothetical protein
MRRKMVEEAVSEVDVARRVGPDDDRDSVEISQMVHRGDQEDDQHIATSRGDRCCQSATFA